jgi:hypothetical protein
MTEIVLKKYPEPKISLFSQIKEGTIFTEGRMTLFEAIRGDILLYVKVLSPDGKQNLMVAIDGAIVKKPDNHTVIILREVGLEISIIGKPVKLKDLSVGQIFSYPDDVKKLEGTKTTDGFFMNIDPIKKGGKGLLVLSIDRNQTLEISTEHEVLLHEYDIVIK